MTRCCRNPNCHVDDGESCDLGELNHLDCPQWSAQPEGEPEPKATASPAARVPWSGSALGLTDLANLTPRGRSILIGVLGAHDAGKTTLLTGCYLQILRGECLAGASFAGSRTLGAWESLAASMRFDDAPRMPTFPPHTPRGTSRVPGLLHIALRGSHREHRDVLLTDAPGEWFTRWAIREDASDAAGAQWTARYADAFLVLADCERLGGPKRGEARSSTRQLLERLGNHVGARPTALIWAKSDKSPASSVQASIRESLYDSMPHATERECSTEKPGSLLLAVEEVLQRAWTPERSRPVVEPVVRYQPFAAYRGSHENP